MDEEARDIADDYSFQKNVLSNKLDENKGDYYSNKPEDAPPKDGFDSTFVQAKPAGTFMSDRQQTMLDEEVQRLESLREQYYTMMEDKETEKKYTLEEIRLMEGREWEPDLPQPIMKCFKCKARFDAKAKQPLSLPCGHNACKSCVIDAESEGQKFECFYDNCVIDGLFDTHPNTAILQKLYHEERVHLELKIKQKVENA
jgi:hypothetical protein